VVSHVQAESLLMQRRVRFAIRRRGTAGGSVRRTTALGANSYTPPPVHVGAQVLQAGVHEQGDHRGIWT
jgi:hypothetical protein